MSKCKHVNIIADYERNTMVCARCEKDIYQDIQSRLSKLEAAVDEAIGITVCYKDGDCGFSEVLKTIDALAAARGESK